MTRILGILCILSLASFGTACGGVETADRARGTNDLRVTVLGLDELRGAPPEIHADAIGHRDLLKEIVAGFRDDAFVSIQVSGPPAGWNGKPEWGASGTVWLTITVAAYTPSPAWVEATWRAKLVAGAFRDLSHERGLPDVLGYSIVTVSPGRPDGGPSRSVITGARRHPILKEAISDITTRVHAGLARAADATGGFRSATVTYYRPDAHAPLVIIEANDARRAAEYFIKEHLIDSSEGAYVEVRDLSGRPVLAVGVATRANSGSTWVAPTSE